ncbi:MAG TPA: DUF4175 family protein, partial [Vicinamibacterales bacterium]|nr:DUF4175 family protein [Vicinamibacterales bacterium]
MAETPGGGTARQELVDVIQTVRKRWRTKLLLRGGIVVLGGALLSLALASWGLQALRFSPAAVIGFRIAIFATFAILVALWFVRPLRRRVSDVQVALFVEEHEPSLQAAILSAVDAGATSGTSSSTSADVPPIILERLIEQAVEKCRTSAAVSHVGQSAVRRNTVILGALVAAAVLLLSIGPEFFRQGASALLVLSRDAAAASPYAIKVEPGDVTIPKGADQTIKATLAGFHSTDVVMMAKSAGETAFQRMPLIPGADDATFEGMMFDIKSPLEYYVEADGVRSATYSMKVVELPAVENLELEYVFPSYTGLAPQKVDSGGDVAALRGTQVRVRVKPTMTSPAGRLQLDPGSPSALSTQTDGTLTGSFTIADDGYYHVELDGPHGEHVTASPKFTIDAIDDRPPTVTFEKPKRDIRANPLEEVPLQARADDDFGVKQLDLVYSVNGGEEKTVNLYSRGAKSLTEVSAGHTVYLEELGVKPGDFVSYYAKATDTDTVKGPKGATSDIYFIEVRPFSQDFRKAQSQAGGGGGGGGGQQNQANALSEQQRQIIAATFNVERDRPTMTADKFKENSVFVGLSQGKLRDQVEEIVSQMRERLGLSTSDNMRQIAEILPRAAAEMKTAEGALSSQKTKDALAAEQRALRQLQLAEQLYDLEVRQGGGGGGGGGGGAQQMADDLADLFQLQLDRQANQYELQQSAQEAQQNANQQVDELAERLRDLARRQLEQARQQQLRGQQQQNGGGGGASQRALADQVEQAARQLEQLRREAERQGQSRQDLADAARRLQESANAMRQAAANGSDGGAQARQAADAIQQAQRLLQENQTANAQQSADDAVKRADDLARQQRDIAAGVQNLGRQQGAERAAQTRQLGDQKDALRNGVGQLEQQLDTLGRQALANGQRDAARKFQEAAGTIRDQATKEIIDYSKQAMNANPDVSNSIESRLSSNLDTIRQRVGQAADAARQAAQGNGLNRAAQQAANLLRGMSSLTDQQQQMAQDQQQGQEGQAGQQGQQGQDQNGRQGQQGQAGQQGQQGQQGQAGQQGQRGQGQQGQQGQGQGQQGQQAQQGQQGQQGQGQQG